MMRKKALVACSICLLAILAFITGYFVGSYNSASHNAGVNSNGVAHKWVEQDTPPLPAISIDNKSIPVVLGTYAWCRSSKNNTGNCVIVDSVGPEEIFKGKNVSPIVVKPNSPISTQAPLGIKEFTLTLNNATSKEDPYLTPSKKRTYIYTIHCDWFADQGNSDFYFLIEVT